MKRIRKYHKWPSLIIGLFLILFAASGIVMNHRNWFSGVNFPRQLMPPDYYYRNWNLAAVKGNVPLDNNNQLIYGNIGIWKTDKDFSSFSDFNAGFGSGMDQRKVFTLLHSEAGNLYAGMLFGLYFYNEGIKKWEQIALPEESPRVVKIAQYGENLLILTRSHLYTFPDRGSQTADATEIPVPRAGDDDGKAGLFRTLWIIHSGELMGLPGKILVDLVGLSLIFIVLSGYYYTFLPSLARRSGERLRKKLRKINRFSINWHNNLGIYGILFLTITTITGMFLRPPLLIPVAYARVNPIPGYVLDHSNRWHDKFRDMVSDPASGELILSTSEGFYRFVPGKDTIAHPYGVQPEVSVMGITAFQALNDSSFIVGSFSGIYQWFPHRDLVLNYITGLPAVSSGRGNPFGSVAVAGVINQAGRPVAMLDYNAGWIPLVKDIKKPEMPGFIAKLPVSLWNLALEVHTGRIFSVILGDFYILYVPLMGLTTLLILITGVWIWLKIKRKKSNKKIQEGQNHENHKAAPGPQSPL